MVQHLLDDSKLTKEIYMKDIQYFIEGNAVTCTVYNEKDVQFMASSNADGVDLMPAMISARQQAEKTRDEYEKK